MVVRARLSASTSSQSHFQFPQRRRPLPPQHICKTPPICFPPAPKPNKILIPPKASLTLFSTLTTISIKHGIGSHVIDNNATVLSRALELWYLSSIVSILTITLLRISAFLHLRQYARTSPQRRILFSVFALTFISSHGYALTLLTQCTPIHHYWTVLLGSRGKCIDATVITNITYIYSAASAVCDWGFALLPILIFWNEEITPKERRGLRGLVFLAFLYVSLPSLSAPLFNFKKFGINHSPIIAQAHPPFSASLSPPPSKRKISSTVPYA
jgi:hypothetical protein